jgi:hypothetical protein
MSSNAVNLALETSPITASPDGQEPAQPTSGTTATNKTNPNSVRTAQTSTAPVVNLASQSPNPVRRIQIRYTVYANVQKTGQSEARYKQINTRGPPPPIDLNLNGLTFSLMKALLFEHLRTHSHSKYPIDVILSQAERASILQWYYSIADPNEDPNMVTPFESQTYNWFFDDFINSAERTSPEARVTIHLQIPEETIDDAPWALVTLVVTVSH